MRVAKPSEKMIVCLVWEGVNKAKGEKSVTDSVNGGPVMHQ